MAAADAELFHRKGIDVQGTGKAHIAGLLTGFHELSRVPAVACDVERARVHFLGVAALGGVAAVAAAGRPAVAVGVLVLVDLAVAVVVDAVGAELLRRHDLAHAVAPVARGLTGLHAAVARPDVFRRHGARVASAGIAGVAGARGAVRPFVAFIANPAVLVAFVPWTGAGLLAIAPWRRRGQP